MHTTAAGSDSTMEHTMLCRVDSDGVLRLRLKPGRYTVRAESAPDAAAGGTEVMLMSGTTNSIVMELEPVPKLIGIVRMPDGTPVAGLQVNLIGATPKRFGFELSPAGPRTDNQGRFEIPCKLADRGGLPATVGILIQDRPRNLVAFRELVPGGSPAGITLQPGAQAVLRFRSQGFPLTNATVSVAVQSGGSYVPLPELDSTADETGTVEIVALSPGLEYVLNIAVPGFGSRTISFQPKRTGRIELDTIEFNRARLLFQGRVVDTDDKPVAGARVLVGGADQPRISTRTDTNGEFKIDGVCAGSVEIYVLRPAPGIWPMNPPAAKLTMQTHTTNLLIKLEQEVGYRSSGSPRIPITGPVLYEDGRPVLGANATVLPTVVHPANWITAAANGRFRCIWNAPPYQYGGPVIIARDPTGRYWGLKNRIQMKQTYRYKSSYDPE